MNISGILVVVTPEHLVSCIDRLDALPGVEVHHRDDASGRIVVTQEAESVRDEMDGLKRIKALPHVVLAEMVYHWFEDDREILDSIPPELNGQDNPNIPAFLNK